MDDRYIGKGKIKYLDKEETKLGAFISLPADELYDLIISLDASTKEYILKVLPNKANDGYTVKINAK